MSKLLKRDLENCSSDLCSCSIRVSFMMVVSQSANFVISFLSNLLISSLELFSNAHSWSYSLACTSLTFSEAPRVKLRAAYLGGTIED